MSNVQYSSVALKNSSSFLKPSIFSIIAQENLLDLFQSSFKHFFKWLIDNYEFLHKFKSHTDFLYLGIHSSIELLYLNYRNALFSEYFYGLKRDRKQTVKAKALSILASIIIPFMKSKLDEAYETLERDVDEHPPRIMNNKRKRIIERLKEIFLKIYPYLHLAWSLSFWYFRLTFIFDLTEFSSPLLKLINVKLFNSDDEQDSWPIYKSIKNKLLKKIFYYLNYAFTGLLFFIQFIDWYQNLSDDEEFVDEQYSKKDLNISLLNENNFPIDRNSSCMEPPKLSSNLLNIHNINNTTACPICNCKRTNECALSTSGFVFCYPCIFKYIKKHNCCPVTKLPCNVNNLVRIYS